MMQCLIYNWVYRRFDGTLCSVASAQRAVCTGVGQKSSFGLCVHRTVPCLALCVASSVPFISTGSFDGICNNGGNKRK